MNGREMDQISKATFKKVITDLVEREDNPLNYYKEMNYVDVTPEYIRDAIKRDRQVIRRKSRGRLLSVAAICIVVLLTISTMVMVMPGKEAEAVRHRLQKQVLGWGELMKDTEESPSGLGPEIVGLTRTFDDWKDLEGAKKFLPELYIPGYIPEGYRFESLTIQKYGSVQYNTIFVFVIEDEKCILIMQRLKGDEESQVMISNTSETFETANAIVHITEDEFTNRISGVFIDGDVLINISAELTLEELKKTLVNLYL